MKEKKKTRLDSIKLVSFLNWYRVITLRSRQNGCRFADDIFCVMSVRRNVINYRNIFLSAMKILARKGLRASGMRLIVPIS